MKGGVTRPTSETRMYVKHWHASIMATCRKQTNGRSRQLNHSDPLPMLLGFGVPMYTPRVLLGWIERPAHTARSAGHPPKERSHANADATDYRGRKRTLSAQHLSSALVPLSDSTLSPRPRKFCTRTVCVKILCAPISLRYSLLRADSTATPTIFGRRISTALPPVCRSRAPVTRVCLGRFQ